MPMRPIITLISDWRLRDPYVAMFKGALLSEIPEANLLDITHYVDMFNLSQTAFLMRQSYRNFPEGSIHLLLTNASATASFSPVMLVHDGHIFIGEDNGVFHLMFGGETALAGRKYSSEDGLDPLQQIVRMVKAVVKGSVDAYTQPYDQFERKIMPAAIHIPIQKSIEGEIIYIDANCNAITNIPVDMFVKAVGNNPFTAEIQSKNTWKISKFYDKTRPEKEMCFTINSLGCIEITMYQGKVAALADLQVGDRVEIQY